MPYIVTKPNHMGSEVEIPVGVVLARADEMNQPDQLWIEIIKQPNMANVVRYFLSEISGDTPLYLLPDRSAKSIFISDLSNGKPTEIRSTMLLRDTLRILDLESSVLDILSQKVTLPIVPK